MKTKVLVLDIDGTLTNSKKEITPETKRGIIHIMERGHKVILASGRPTPGMRRYADELELAAYGGYLLSFNGGRIINCKSGENRIPAYPSAACHFRALPICLQT